MFCSVGGSCGPSARGAAEAAGRSRISKLSSLLDVVEAGQSVVITRRGRAIAELVPRRALRDLLPQLQTLRDSLPEQSSNAVETIQTIWL